MRQSPKGMPVTEQPTFVKLQKMKGEEPQSIPESKKHEETSESERQAPDLKGTDSVQDEPRQVNMRTRDKLKKVKQTLFYKWKEKQ